MWFVYHQQKVYRKKTTDLSPVASLNIISHVCRMYLNFREYRRGNNNGQSRETGNIDAEKQKHNHMCVGHHYAQTSTNNVNKTNIYNKYKQLEVKTNRT
jgi:hypothetical protein